MPQYERLKAWQVSHELALDIYRCTRGWPKSELYGLTSQARRAAYSIGANLVEGLAKRGRKELRRYLDISLGSHSELSYALRLAKDLDYLREQDWHELSAKLDEAGRLLWGLYRSVSPKGT
jgi:four helix bundle protein